MKRDKTSLFALLAAAVILGSVGIKSYFDYRLAVESKQSPAPADPAAQAAATPAPESATPEEEAASIDRLPRSVLPPIPPEILNGSAQDPAAPVAGGSPEKPRMTAEIDTLRRETELYQEKLDQLRSGKSSVPAQAAPAPPASVGAVPPPPGSFGPAATPLSALQAAMDPDTPILAPEPGTTGPIPAPALPGSPAAESPAQSDAEIAALAEQVKRQPAIAQVVEYDAQFAFLVINGGTNRNLAPEMRLAVRRGSEILGFIKVVEVEATQSIAELMSKNKFSPTARKPQPGDDIIAFNLF